jgi:hypothetical protein
VLAELTAAAQLLGYSTFGTKLYRGQAVCLEFLCLVLPLLVALLQPESALVLVIALVAIAVAVQYWTNSTLQNRRTSSSDAERQQCNEVSWLSVVVQLYCFIAQCYKQHSFCTCMVHSLTSNLMR